jgi:hypothetical protein
MLHVRKYISQYETYRIQQIKRLYEQVEVITQAKYIIRFLVIDLILSHF